MENMDYMKVFLEESREHLENLNKNILELENEPDNKDIVNEIFRSAHTLKGMSASMGFNNVAELTHKMENLLSKVREGEMAATSDVIDVLFKCLDSLEKMIGTIATGGTDTEEDVSELVNLLLSYIDGKVPVQTSVLNTKTDLNKLEINEFEKAVIEEGFSKGYKLYKIHLKLPEDSLMKYPKILLVNKELENLKVETVKTVPTIEEIEKENFKDTVLLLVLAQVEKDFVEKATNSISEVTGEVTEVKNVDELLTKPTVNNSVTKEEKSEKKAGVGKKVNTANQSIRVDINRLDSLMNLVGELVINRTRLQQIAKELKNRVDLNETVETLMRITTDLQEEVMKVRMVPIEQVFNRFPRMVRDLAKELNKEVELEMIGKETELDRTVIDEIADPLVHLIRNALDHGIETPEEREAKGKPRKAVVKLVARHEGNNVMIEVEEDGRGIDSEKVKKNAIKKGILTEKEAEAMTENELVNLIFRAGFSTAEKVSDISGRGVGLDVVRSKIENLSGKVFVETAKDKGTKFTIVMPLTLAIIKALLVENKNEIYAIPLGIVVETIAINPRNIRKVQNEDVILQRGRVLPLKHLREIFGQERLVTDEDLPVVIIYKDKKQYGLVVDRLIGQQDIVIKSLGNILDDINGFAGATILGDGKVSLILDIAKLW